MSNGRADLTYESNDGIFGDFVVIATCDVGVIGDISVGHVIMAEIIELTLTQGHTARSSEVGVTLNMGQFLLGQGLKLPPPDKRMTNTYTNPRDDS